jgi:hypothetical protein
LRTASPIVQRPDTERRPVSVAFRAPSLFRGVLEQPASGDIAVERGGRITLEAGLRMDIEGRLEAPGGTIAAAVGRRPGSGSEYRGFRGNQGLYVGPGASVSVDGVDATWRDSAGRINGSVLAGGTISFDAWDGYPAQRDRLLETFLRSSPNTLVVTGDTHAAWANELDVKRGGARAGVEFGTTSVTSPGFGDLFKGVDFGGAIMGKNPVVKWTDQVARGYLLLTLTKSQAKADFMKVSNVLSKDYKLEVEARFKVAAQREGTGAIEKA